MSQLEGLVPGTWQIDPTHTDIGFTVRHLISKVRGTFEEFEGEIVIAENPLESEASATVQLSTINTGTAQRDDHLRSSDFFEVDQHPVMRFSSTGVRANGDGYTLTGDLTVKNVTREIELEVDFLGVGPDPWGGTRAGFEATGKISRKEFGVDFNIPLEGDKFVIGDQVTIQLQVEAVLQVEAAVQKETESANA
ncbi:MAG TPA: YceI family protein [Nocardioidaceae bacterium]|nr:YceI family protein [Nocardioidaceae bacterium]